MRLHCRARMRRRGAGRRPARVKREWAEVEEEGLGDEPDSSEDEAAAAAADASPTSSDDAPGSADEDACAAGWRYARARPARWRRPLVQGLCSMPGGCAVARVSPACGAWPQASCCLRPSCSKLALKHAIQLECEVPKQSAPVNPCEAHSKVLKAGQWMRASLSARGCGPAGPNGTSARQARMASSPPLNLAPFKRPRTQLQYVPRQRSRQGEPAAALGLSWDTGDGAPAASPACSGRWQLQGAGRTPAPGQKIAFLVEGISLPTVHADAEGGGRRQLHCELTSWAAHVAGRTQAAARARRRPTASSARCRRCQPTCCGRRGASGGLGSPARTACSLPWPRGPPRWPRARPGGRLRWTAPPGRWRATRWRSTRRRPALRRRPRRSSRRAPAWT